MSSSSPRGASRSVGGRAGIVRVGIIGLGYWGPNLARNFSAAPGAELRVCCDRDESRFKSLAARYPAARFTTRVADVLADPEVDAVAIATPVRAHHELAKRALEAGKHVLVEKPLTLDVAHAEELVALAKRRKRVLMVDHVFVYSPAVAKMKEIVDSGKLGKLLFIDGIRINLGLFRGDVNVAWDLAPHDLSIVDHLLGRLPRSVSAVGSTHSGTGIEDVAYLNLDFGGGLMANFHVNWLSPVKIRHLILGGSDHSLVYNDLDASEKVKVYDRGMRVSVGSSAEERRRVLVNYRSGDVWSPNVANDEPLARMAADFVSCVREGRRPVADGAAGLRVVRILAAAQRSIRARGARIPLG